MILYASRYFKINFVLLLLFISMFAGKCLNHGDRKMLADYNARKAKESTQTKNLLKSIKGIKYTEVSRTFDNGLSFSPVGYQLVPEWRISFPSADSVNIYSPKRGRFLNAPVVFDHDSIFNVAWAWLKLKQLSKDSLRFEVLHVKNKVIQNEKYHAYMKFYANDYIKNVLHSDTDKLRRPSRLDTQYIKAKTLYASKVLDSAFGGLQPALLTSKSPLLKIKRGGNPMDDINGDSPYDKYLSPEYDIVIHKAYDDFSYSYTVFVDEKGTLIFRNSLEAMMPEFKKITLANMKAITDGYLKLYLNVKPGKTLGIPHTSIIFLNVVGYKK